MAREETQKETAPEEFPGEVQLKEMGELILDVCSKYPLSTRAPLCDVESEPTLELPLLTASWNPKPLELDPENERVRG